MSNPSLKAVEAKLKKHYRDSFYWTYKVASLSPLVIVALPNNNNIRNEAVPFHVCNFEAWCNDVNESGGVTSEFHNDRCKNCGTEYKLAKFIAITGKLNL